MSTIKDINQMIAAQVYPPTHHYLLRNDGDPVPLGPLLERVQWMDKLCPDFWKGRRLLDVGCSKGYFLLRGARAGMSVWGLDPDPDAIHICRPVIPDAALGQFGFREWPGFSIRKFDRVLLGNVHHYLYMEAGGWAFLDKIAAMMSGGGLLLVEGPVKECPDLDTMKPWPMMGDLRQNFDLEAAAGLRHFELMNKAQTSVYTPGRSMWLFRRRFNALDVEMPLNEYPMLQAIGEATPTGRTSIYRTRNDYFVKLCVDRPMPRWLERSLAIASVMPNVSNVAGILIDGNGERVGWLEEPIYGRTFEYREPSEVTLRAWLRRCVLLSRMGYVDQDAGSVNFILRDHDTYHTDKNSTFPVIESDADVAGWPNGRIWRTLRLCYSKEMISDESCQTLSSTLLSRDPKVVEASFQAALEACVKQ